MKATKLEKHTAKIKGQRVAGHVNFSDDGDRAYVWTRAAWCAGITIDRGDMDPSEFKALVSKIAALAKTQASNGLISSVQ